LAPAVHKKDELNITRIIDAPRERVWNAWTDPEQLKTWWGPKGFTAPFIRMDIRVGGSYLTCMRSPDGKDYWSTGVFREIVPESRLVMTDSFADEKGNVVPGSYYGMASDFPREMLVTVTFEDADGRTKLTLKYSGAKNITESDLASMTQGWNESLDKLAESFGKYGGGGTRPASEKYRARLIAEPGKQEFVVIREFDAPRELVFAAFTDPALYVRWIGPRRFTTKLETFESRSGGRWRYISRDKDGNEFGFHGVNHDVLPPERIIGTFEFEGLPETGHVILQKATFEALPGNRTRFTGQSVFLSVADRDGMLGSGMEEGMNESYDRLDELLEELKKKQGK
jgi:uncharacterized protein YndB with AHSA1/START domain